MRNLKVVIFGLIILGLILRVLGLLYNGNHNLDTYKEWGHNVRTKGLAWGFVGGYYPIAYLLFAAADYLSSFTPTNWWWPYKLINLIFEIVILLSLFKLASNNKLAITVMYWLNPWFLIPMAWAGFWDSFYTLLILFSVILLDFIKLIKYKFFFSGFFLSVALLTKPQTFAPLSFMLIYFLFFHLLKFKFKDFFHWILGFTLLPLLFNFYFFLFARGPIYLIQSYLNLDALFPTLVGSEINVWYTVTKVLMYVNNQTGPVYSFNAGLYPYHYLVTISRILFYLMLLIFVLLTFVKNKIPRFYFLRGYTFSLILLSQILTNSHAYHFYPGSLFLIVLILIDKYNREIFILWLVSLAIHFYNIFLNYGFGRDIGTIIPLWREPVLSILGIFQFFAVLGFIYFFLRRLSFDYR